jgi:hypothetical protein
MIDLIDKDGNCYVAVNMQEWKDFWNALPPNLQKIDKGTTVPSRLGFGVAFNERGTPYITAYLPQNFEELASVGILPVDEQQVLSLPTPPAMGPLKDGCLIKDCCLIFESREEEAGNIPNQLDDK